jgi:class 3 adenylate cyclase
VRLPFASVSLTVNVYLHLEESNDFQEAFFEQSVKVTEAVGNRLEDRIFSLDYFEMTLVSQALSTGATGPKLYLPHFEKRGNKTSALAHSISLSVLPIVTADTRLDYDNFSVMMQQWIPEGLTFQEIWADSSWVQPDDWEVTVGKIEPTIGTLTAEGERVVATGPGPFLPKWQSTPVLDDLSSISLDLLSHPGYEKILKAGLQSGRVIIGETYDPFEENEDSTDKHEILKKYLQRWREVGRSYEDDPVTDLVFPVYDSFFGDRNLVGLIHNHIYLRNYLSKILVEGEGPLVATFENTCGQMHSYKIEGHEVSYLGTAGSLEYSDEIHETLTSFKEMTKLFDADETVDGECLYSLRMAPHDALSAKFATQDPVIYTVVLACVFLFTSFVFLAYDILVERRQRKVMAKALQSGNIVSSLFPKAVRDRMYAKPNETQARQRPEQAFNGKSTQLNSMMDDEQQAKNDILTSEPVADLYPNCTVLFADLKGFTQWSSNRAPTDVFKLLETLYMNFDSIAKRRRVFKVETIGDCYVAVTGVPHAQDKHASIMTKFANECMTRMRYVLPDLVSVLGEDVAELSMRVGLHSGPVTAGVLRGEKGRFQLFGDTVNTAARMESSGQGGRIHISEATAQALRLAGLYEWVSPREERVNPKGKGLMQTYWVQAPLRSKSLSSSGHSTDTPNSQDDKSEDDARWTAADRKAPSKDDGDESDADYGANRGGYVSDLGYASNRGYAAGSEEAIERVRAKLHARLSKGERN